MKPARGVYLGSKHAQDLKAIKVVVLLLLSSRIYFLGIPRPLTKPPNSRFPGNSPQAYENPIRHCITVKGMLHLWAASPRTAVRFP